MDFWYWIGFSLLCFNLFDSRKEGIMKSMGYVRAVIEYAKDYAFSISKNLPEVRTWFTEWFEKAEKEYDELYDTQSKLVKQIEDLSKIIADKDEIIDTLNEVISGMIKI